MSGCWNLNLMFLVYYFTSDAVYTKHRKQGQQNEHITDGSEFMKRVVGGSKLNSRPKFLMFTAPYKLCEGECSDERSVMGFPVYLGNYAKKVYRDTYIRNYNKELNQTDKITHPPKSKSKKTNKRRETNPNGRSTTSTEPPIFTDDKKERLNFIINKKSDCSCPYLDPNICYKKRNPAMRQKQEIFIDDIKKLFTIYRKTKDII
ncbi:PREDICTED: uncharacterized protein LOC106113591 [Papilio xuthus]|uniref:Uncharacterized protein LOC106113591 n=1 Tax=Papilio xuthus TaxID=66420 RepID=A0AAJ7E420_PAPXU|nr:PREDICTED: uncharacterized protein LOC106113591 [Papilio xuthus]